MTEIFPSWNRMPNPKSSPALSTVPKYEENTNYKKKYERSQKQIQQMWHYINDINNKAFLLDKVNGNS
jgi:hypothetical protein